jgi:tRNA-2-methylthio-N6-dimethylallyladenosine synthase
MKRLYRWEDYRNMVQLARDLIPGVTFSSDFIVGFPGETVADFRATLKAVQEVKYDQIFAFKYSARPGTPACRLPDDVPLGEKKRRLAEVLALQSRVWQKLAQAQIGEFWRGWVESPARRPAGAWKVRTANNRKVIIKKESLAVGEEVSFRVTGCENTTFWGEILTEAR